VFEYEPERANRVIWKLARGLYFREVGTVLPKTVEHVVLITNPISAARDLPILEDVYPHVRDTASMGKYGAVFDYKWVSVRSDDGAGRMHTMAMLLWDGIIAVVIFHDPTCRCERCAARQPTNA
jgi:hypothetical protein